eukprot:TRINITY_DN1850_c0_g3_i4.p1 TRINITY_DN1850_c0_g3~~TRINITY_DN1850_c0_g3_i4.p1  ORF type:complete len:350 (+),score=69.39 TRINITY_DN1850_c0_g3_i4:81-1130(+)
MSCCGGGSDPDARKQSKGIETQLKKDRKQNECKVKLLLLGTGDAGKSTFARQMKVLHKEGFNEADKLKFTTILKSNALVMMRHLINGASQKGYQIDQKLMPMAKAIIDAKELTPEIGGFIKLLWMDNGIRKMHERGSELSQLSCQSEHYFNHVERISKEDYIPTDEDILKAKMKTTGIIETEFKAGGFEFTIVDVGGQRTERRKWLHCFDNVTAVIYLAALDAYDLYLEEDENTNRMQESLKLFAEVSASQWFKNTSFVLFLNKKDLFQQKIKNEPLSKLFPEYDGGADYEAAISFVKQKYTEVFARDGRTLHPFVTCAVDTKNVRKVFDSVKHILLSSVLNEMNLIGV